MTALSQRDAIIFIHAHPEQVLQRDRSGKGFICPFCGSGSGAHGSGMTTLDGVHFRCWACDEVKNADLIDIIGRQHGAATFGDKLAAACRAFGITLETPSAPSASASGRAPGVLEWGATYDAPENEAPAPAPAPAAPAPVAASPSLQAPQAPAPQQQAPQVTGIKKENNAHDFSEFFARAHADINKTNYHRGLSAETLKRFNIGYVENWKAPNIAPEKVPYVPATPRLIIPINKYHYLARYAGIKGGCKEGYEKQHIGKMENSFFNARALFGSKPCFIVEGEIDAMSLYEIGAAAIGLGSAARVTNFLNFIDAHRARITAPLIIAPDNDEDENGHSAGAAAGAALAEGLRKNNLPFVMADVKALERAGIKIKDCNDALNHADRAAFIAWARDAERRAQIEQMGKPAEATDAYLDTFRQHLKDAARTPPFSTGFINLDKILDHGLYPGLYIIGAISSLGKTTLCLNIADHAATNNPGALGQGRHVIIFSLEMSKDELIAKNLSRLTFIMDKNNAITTRDILTWEIYPNHDQNKSELFEQALKDYREKIAKNLFIIEGDLHTGTAAIRAEIERHIAIYGVRPLVVVDYLQIIASDDEFASDKQRIDSTVSELKRVSRDCSVPILAISSFNRDNYKTDAQMSSFKESGIIEYSSDVLIALQYKREHEESAEEAYDRAINAARDGQGQDIEAVILKNRNGLRGSVDLKFMPKFNYFIDSYEGGRRPQAPASPSLQVSKRSLEREKYKFIFDAVQKGGIATLRDFADHADISQSKLRRQLEDLGGFIIDATDKKNITVKLEPPEAEGSAPEQATDSAPAPEAPAAAPAPEGSSAADDDIDLLS